MFWVPQPEHRRRKDVVGTSTGPVAVSSTFDDAATSFENLKILL